MKSADFTQFEVIPSEEFGCDMTMNGDEGLGLDFSVDSLKDLASGLVSNVYETQKKVGAELQTKVEAQALKTGGEFVAQTAQDILSQPEVKKLAKEQVEEAAIQKVATTVREGYTAVMASPGKYFLYLAGGLFLIAAYLKFSKKK